MMTTDELRRVAEVSHLRWRRDRLLDVRESLLDRGDRLPDTFGDPEVVPFAVELARADFARLSDELAQVDRELEQLDRGGR